MKEYPSILGSDKAPCRPCVAFYKYDGSNLRFEWHKKTGWCKYGTRHRLFDANDPTYGCAIGIFHKNFADQLTKVFESNKNYKGCQQATVYCEFFGPHSFAGQHDIGTLQYLGFDVTENEPKQLVLFDVNIHKKGFVAPQNFISDFECVRIPEVVYFGELNDAFINDVRHGHYNVVEGVVAKGGEGHKLWMRKIKTLAYLDELKKRFHDKWESYWE